MNAVHITGRLTRNPEVRYKDDLAIARFSVAINRVKGPNGEDRGADFPNIVVFGRVAENIEKYLSKGSLISVSGRIQTGSYKGKEGNTVYTTDIVAEKVEFLSTKVNNPDAPKRAEYMEPIEDEDCPF